jgi:hypothetical protein
MTPERVAALVLRWVRFYTRGLTADVAERRRDEIAADLHDHIGYARANGDPEPRIAREIVARMLRGAAADLAWRREQPKETSMTKPIRRSIIRVAVGVALILSIPLIAMQVTHEVAWSVGDFVLAGVLLTVIGATLELAAKKAGSLALALAVGAVGAAAAAFGRAGDAPGLVLLGILLVASASALGVRRARRTRGVSARQ